jgi:hypothetical protein
MENDELLTKDELVDQIDSELAEMEERTGFPDRDADYFHRLELMTFVRNAIYNMPISDYQADLIEQRGGCSVLDDIYNFWREHVMEWGETHDEKLTMSYDLVREYIDNVERYDLTRALYDRALADIQEYTAELRSSNVDSVLNQSRYFVGYNAALSMLEPKNRISNQSLLALLTYDRPVKAICDMWQGQDNSEVVGLKDLSRARDSVIKDRRAKLDQNPESIQEQHPETQRYIDLYASRYGDAQTPGQPELDVELET